MSEFTIAQATENTADKTTPLLPNISLEKLKDVDVVKELSTYQAELLHLTIDWGLRLVAAIVILILGWVIGNWIDRRFENFRHLDHTLKNFLGGFFKYSIVAMAIITVIGLFGIPMASLLAVLGAAGLAIGLALQGTLANIASGVMLLILRPFNVGDYIVWGDQGGLVKSLGLFGTELAMPDNVYIFAPNSKIWGNEIRNYSRNTLRRQDIGVSISYGDNINKAFTVIQDVMGNEERIFKDIEGKEPQVVVDAMADFSINLIARFWSDNTHYWDLRYGITKTIKEELDRNGITIPFPTRTVEVIGDTGNLSEKQKKEIVAGAGA